MSKATRPNAWVDFLRESKGKGLTMSQLSTLYRQTHDVRPVNRPSVCAGLSVERCAAKKNCKTNKNNVCYTTKRRPTRSHCAGLSAADCAALDDCAQNKKGFCYITKKRSSKRRSASPKRSVSPKRKYKPRRKLTAVQLAAKKAEGARLLDAARASATSAMLDRSKNAAARVAARAYAVEGKGDDGEYDDVSDLDSVVSADMYEEPVVPRRAPRASRPARGTAGGALAATRAAWVDKKLQTSFV